MRLFGPGAADERPEALAQFAESARGQKSKKLTADEHTAPIPTDNREKHKVAETLLNKSWKAMRSGKPLTIKYAPTPDLNPTSCAPDNCRRLIDVLN